MKLSGDRVRAAAIRSIVAVRLDVALLAYGKSIYVPALGAVPFSLIDQLRSVLDSDLQLATARRLTIARDRHVELMYVPVSR